MLRKVLRLLTKGIGMALAIFAVGGMVWDIMNAGNYVMVEWNYTRMVIGSILVGIGFSVPCLIYDHPTLPYPVKVMVHMGIGCGIYLIIALAVGWIPRHLGAGRCMLAILTELSVAFLIWFGFTLHYKQMARKIDKRIKELKNQQDAG